MLAEQCGGSCAAVIDDGSTLYCTTHSGYDEAARRFHRQEVAMRPEVRLKRGGRLSVVRAVAPDRGYVAESFAAIYIVIVWFERSFDPFTTRRLVKAALPRIEALTLALPPPFGPDAGSGAGKGRA